MHHSRIFIYSSSLYIGLCCDSCVMWSWESSLWQGKISYIYYEYIYLYKVCIYLSVYNSIYLLYIYIYIFLSIHAQYVCIYGIIWLMLKFFTTITTPEFIHQVFPLFLGQKSFPKPLVHPSKWCWKICHPANQSSQRDPGRWQRVTCVWKCRCESECLQGRPLVVRNGVK